ncbi:hypothetical protein [Microlunatus sp. GCM10028923]|uniref:hypothetical protein n=1 Tax=Microlunatus sp. GCM10028923 TaxID=3273400 RepID=UPI00362211F0
MTEDWPDKMRYPGDNGDQHWDKGTLRELMQPVLEVQRKYGLRIYVGEFSAIRWAPGAAQYLRDSVELFEEYGWSWTYHSFRDWHGWQLDYTDTMTSDANSAAAMATQPTDRSLIIKSYLARNTYAPDLDLPRTPTDLVRNGDFTDDADADGLADGWAKGRGIQTSLAADGETPRQDVVADGTSSSYAKGLDQEWISVTPGHGYRLQAKIKVDLGTVRFWHYDVTSPYAFTDSGVVEDVSPTGGAYRDSRLEFVATDSTAQVGVRFWSTAPAAFSIQQVQLIDLGPDVVIRAPRTTATVTAADGPDSARVDFAAVAFDGKTVDRTEYRIVGKATNWTAAADGGLALTDPGTYLIGYRSVDSDGVVEPAQAVAVVVRRSGRSPREAAQ